jgi:hypothetical protein
MTKRNKGAESLGSILMLMGALTPQQREKLEDKCHNCALDKGSSCGDCPVDKLVARLVIASGEVSSDTVEEAKKIQAGLTSDSDHKKLIATSRLARASRQATIRSNKALQKESQFIARKSDPKGYPAVSDLKAEAG